MSALTCQGPAFRSRLGWIHEIKHDGYRILGRRDRTGVWLITRNGSDFTDRFPYMAAALELLPVRSCIIDGEAIVCDESGLAVFELIRSHGSKMLRLPTCWNSTEGICGDAPSRSEKAWRETAPRFRPRSGHRAQQASRGGRCDCFSRGLPARLRGDRVEAARLNLSPGALASVA